MITDTFEAWLVSRLSSDATIRREMAAAGVPVTVRRGVALIGQGRVLPDPSNRDRVRGPWVQFDLLASDQARERCGDEREVELTYQVKVVAPGDSTGATRTVADRIHDLLSGATNEIGGGGEPTADATTETADAGDITADATGSAGTSWVVRRVSVVSYVEAPGAHRFVHQGGVYAAHIAI